MSSSSPDSSPPLPFHNNHHRHTLPAVLMRAGTSKALFLHRHHLPISQAHWSPILLSAMGSRDSDPRQLNGMGGGTSTTSKIAVVSKSQRPGIDVEYTFVAVGVGKAEVDFSGNCGNVVAGVGPFALDEGLVRGVGGETEMDIRIFNTNTQRTIIETIRVTPDGRFQEEGDFAISGVKGTASQIKVAFVEPAGSMTGSLFPTGNRQDHLHISQSSTAPFTVRASLVDAANPFVFVDASTMPRPWHDLARDDAQSLEIVEAIRREGAIKMGLAPDIHSASLVRGTPKIAILSPAKAYATADKQPSIFVTSYSMGKLHPSFQLTGAVCLSAAVSAPGTIASEIREKALPISPPRSPSDGCPEIEKKGKEEESEEIVMEHGAGVIVTEVKIVRGVGDAVKVRSVTVSRTARRLFEGNVLISP